MDESDEDDSPQQRRQQQQQRKQQLQSQQQRRRASEDVGVLDLDDVDEGRTGIVEMISLKNFMCHTSLEVSLNSNLNFIIGRNGSGKSAVMTALTVGLGGRAR